MSVNVRDWLEAYKVAWETKDADAAAALFSHGASYREEPYADAFAGRQGVHDYWTRVTATQEDIDFRYGTPVVEGARAAEWWVTMRNGGADVTLAGEFLLVFDDDGLCRELREYWHFTPEQKTPPAGWGA